jgi:hypothetical protein
MKMTPVKSSMICAIGYDAKTQEMRVVFNSGAVYHYLQVPPEDYEGLLKAGSKGRYMNENIIGVYDEYSPP